MAYLQAKNMHAKALTSIMKAPKVRMPRCGSMYAIMQSADDSMQSADSKCSCSRSNTGYSTLRAILHMQAIRAADHGNKLGNHAHE